MCQGSHASWKITFIFQVLEMSSAFTKSQNTTWKSPGKKELRINIMSVEENSIIEVKEYCYIILISCVSLNLNESYNLALVGFIFILVPK